MKAARFIDNHRGTKGLRIFLLGDAGLRLLSSCSRDLQLLHINIDERLDCRQSTSLSKLHVDHPCTANTQLLPQTRISRFVFQALRDF